MTSGAQIDKWLVRTEKNFISGPFSREKVREMISQGELTAQDEVCQANSYWIYLHETEEVQRQLGDVAPRSARAGERSEETETEIELRVHWDSNAAQAAPPAPAGVSHADEIPELGENVTEETAMLSNRALREFQPKKDVSIQQASSGKPHEFFNASVKAGAEQPSYWRGIAAVLVISVAALLLKMIWVLATR